MLSLADATTYVFDADGLILGRLASASADILLKAAREDRDDKVIIINAEKAIVSGRPRAVLNNYHKKYELNHARKGPFFPYARHDPQASRPWHAALPKESSGRRALRNLRVEIGCPSHLSGDLPEGHQHGDDSKFRRDLPDRFIRLGDISADLGAPAHRWTGGDQ